MNDNNSLNKYTETNTIEKSSQEFLDKSSKIINIDELLDDEFLDEYFNKKLKSNNLKIKNVKTQ